MPKYVERALEADRDAVIPRLIDIVKQQIRDESGDQAWAAVYAAELLCRWRVEEVVELLLDALDGHILYHDVSFGLAKFGAAVVEPCLARLEGAGPDHRFALMQVLSGCDVTDERIRAAIVAFVREDPELGSFFAICHGDVSFVGELQAVFDALLRPECNDEDHRTLLHVAEAIRWLSGDLDGARSARLSAARAAYLHHLDIGIATWHVDLRMLKQFRRLPGHLLWEPCWCGSGKPYLHCHGEEGRFGFGKR